MAELTMWTWIIGSRIGRALGSVLAGLAFVGGVFLAGKRKGAQDVKQRLSDSDKRRADATKEKVDEILDDARDVSPIERLREQGRLRD